MKKKIKEKLKRKMEILFLEELVKTDKIIQQLFDDVGLELPDEEDIKAKTVTADTQKTVLLSDLLNSRDKNKTVKIKVGKFLKRGLSKLSDGEIQNLVRYYGKLYLNNQEDFLDKFNFKETKKVSKYYDICDEEILKSYTPKDNNKDNLVSCMTNKSDLTKFYDDRDDITLLVLFDENNNIKGRALVWRNVDGAKNNTFVDRVYPADNNTVREYYEEYAKRKEWSHRATEDIEDKRIDNFNDVEISYVYEDFDINQKIPYIDTLTYGKYEDGTLYLTNKENSFKNYYKFEDPTGTDMVNKLKYNSNENYIYQGGIIDTNEDIEYNKIIIKDITAGNIKVRDEITATGTIQANDIMIGDDLNCKNDVKVNNIESSGTISCNSLKVDNLLKITGDIVTNVVISKKIMSYGDIDSNTIIVHDKLNTQDISCEILRAKDAEVRDVTCDDFIVCETLSARKIKTKNINISESFACHSLICDKAKIEYWVDGVFLDGIWIDGIWEKGNWVDGEWKIGWIHDPDKKGNFDPEWEWDEEYVRSKISPKEYFG